MWGASEPKDVSPASTRSGSTSSPSWGTPVCPEAWALGDGIPQKVLSPAYLSYSPPSIVREPGRLDATREPALVTAIRPPPGQNGTQCEFCHICPPGEKKRRQKLRRKDGKIKM
eukprot:g17084.t1